MLTLYEFVFALFVALMALFAPQVGAVVLLAMIYLRLDGRARR